MLPHELPDQLDQGCSCMLSALQAHACLETAAQMVEAMNAGSVTALPMIGPRSVYTIRIVC